MMFPRLLAPWLLAGKHRFAPKGKPGQRSMLILLLGVLVSLLLGIGSHKVFGYFQSQNELGVILCMKIFQMIWITFFAMLIFSSMVAAISTLYISEDNEILLSAPLSAKEIFRSRFVVTTLNTSWMVMIFSLPVFGTFGLVFEAGPWYWPLLAYAIPAIAATACGLAMIITMLLVYVFPARRTKDIVLYLSLCSGLLLYLVFRFIRPEELVNPDQYGQFIEYFSAISVPAGPWIPAAWAANALADYLMDREIDWLLVALLGLTPAALFVLGEMVMAKVFFPGYSKSQESFGGSRLFGKMSRPGGSLRWIYNKELKHFTRDSSEWSQLFMIGALIIVYLYNFKVLPLDRSPLPTVFISNLIAFANIGLTGFLAASLATRFVYPSVGAERGAFYLIASSPLSLGRFLWYKCLFYLFPFSLLSLILVIVSNRLLGISGPMWWISIVVSLLITWTVLGLGFGFGSYFADFKAENRTASMGPGAILFLFSAVLYQLVVLALGAIPTYRLIRRSVRAGYLHTGDLLWVATWLVGSLGLSVLLIMLANRLGINRLANQQSSQ